MFIKEGLLSGVILFFNFELISYFLRDYSFALPKLKSEIFYFLELLHLIDKFLSTKDDPFLISTSLRISFSTSLLMADS